MKHQGKNQYIPIHKTDRPPSMEDAATRPDPEVCEKKPRRHFTASYKLRILKEFRDEDSSLESFKSLIFKRVTK